MLSQWFLPSFPNLYKAEGGPGRNLTPYQGGVSLCWVPLSFLLLIQLSNQQAFPHPLETGLRPPETGASEGPTMLSRLGAGRLCTAP